MPFGELIKTGVKKDDPWHDTGEQRWVKLTTARRFVEEVLQHKYLNTETNVEQWRTMTTRIGDLEMPQTRIRKN